MLDRFVRYENHRAPGWHGFGFSIVWKDGAWDVMLTAGPRTLHWWQP